MNLSFLTEDENRELVYRIDREREPEEQRHQCELSKIYHDYQARGLASSTAYIRAAWAENINHVATVCRIARTAVFDLIVGKGTTPATAQISETASYCKALAPCPDEMKRKMADYADGRGLSKDVARGILSDHSLEDAIQREAHEAVFVRAAEINRQVNQQARERRSTRIANWSQLIVGSVLGVVGTLVAQYLMKYLP